MVLYRLLITVAACLALPPLVVFSLVTGWHRPGLRQRFAFYPPLPAKSGPPPDSPPDSPPDPPPGPRIWLHVASVGEALAALTFIAALRQLVPDCQLTLTAMTVRGRDVARRHLADVPCFLAPLDVPWIVGRAIERIEPDLYIAFESEMWPVTIHSLRRRGCPALLTNGRMTAKAAQSWRRFPWLFRAMANALAGIAVIGEEDRERFAALGARADRISVVGNLKYDHRLGDDDQRKLGLLRGLCALDGEALLGGSTHTGEEKMLLAVWRRLCQKKPLALILVPRHLDRLAELRAWLRRENEAWQEFSTLRVEQRSEQPHRERIILVDTYGDLPILYGLADYIFIGGTLTPKGGHNPLEAALWNKAVWHGPDVGDFAALYGQLDEAGAAFAVASGDELFNQINFYRRQGDAYRLACQRAGEIAAAQSGAAARQAALALEALTKTGHAG